MVIMWHIREESHFQCYKSILFIHLMFIKYLPCASLKVSKTFFTIQSLYYAFTDLAPVQSHFHFLFIDLINTHPLNSTQMTAQPPQSGSKSNPCTPTALMPFSFTALIMFYYETLWWINSKMAPIIPESIWLVDFLCCPLDLHFLIKEAAMLGRSMQ